jgi:hypothetical protein
MPAAFRAFFQRHPVLREVLWWSAPALLFGAVLRVLLLNYLPYAYWGSDSKSYYSFAHMLLTSGDLSLDEKRRYLYPLLMAPISVLPGAPLKWVAWLQHALGLMTVLPVAYIARKVFRFWRWWIVPITVLYAGLPIYLWYEHELLGEAIFFAALAWAFGGWVAWVMQPDPARARRLFWWFFVPLAVALLTKPSGRFFLPGLAIGLVAVCAWRVLDWRRWLALALLVIAAATVGSKKQAGWLLYTSTFPLTQLDSPRYADYKAEIRPYAEPFVRNPDVYYKADKRGLDGLPAPFDFLESPSEENAPPLWAALDRDSAKKREVYMALAIEGIRAQPLVLTRMALQRFIASVNPSEFGEERFSSDFYPAKLKGLYEGAQETMAAGKRSSLPMAFGLGKNAALPAFADFAPRLTPSSGSIAERAVLGWTRAFHAVSDLVTIPRAADRTEDLLAARPTWLGWWCVLALALSFAFPRALGVWVVAAGGYVVLVFLVTHVHTRYFAPAWVVVFPVLAVPLDLLFRGVFRRRA